jgi:hypothetical protein
LTDTTPIGARGANPFNVVDGSPAERALLVRLDRWVSQGVAPPPSAFPRLADGTAVARETILEQFRFFSSTFAGAALLDPRLLPRLRRLDQAQAQAHEYPSYAPAVDADGNEVVGIRMPDVRVALATHTGWVPRHPAIGGDGQLLDMMGSTLPFPRSEADRARRRDPRSSLADRYRDRVVQTYGPERGHQVRYIEAFEVSEYGAPLDAAARARLFPFLPAASTADTAVAHAPFARKEWVDIPEEE